MASHVRRSRHMDFKLSCESCGMDVEYDSNETELNTAVDCDCGARYVVTISMIRG